MREQGGEIKDIVARNPLKRWPVAEPYLVNDEFCTDMNTEEHRKKGEPRLQKTRRAMTLTVKECEANANADRDQYGGNP